MSKNFSIAHVRAEARLGDDVVAELQADEVGDQRVVAVGDVGERPAVHQARLALERLDQVGLDRVLEQHGHRAGGAEVLGGDRLAAVERCSATVIAPSRRRRSCRSRDDGQDRHDLGGGGDVESGLARVAVGAAAEADRRSGAGRGRSCPPRGASRCAARRSACGLPCRIEASSIAASRLLAAPMAWMSPVKCRLRSSIGTTWVMPPPAAPPLMPNTGPSEGSRRQSTGRWPMCAEALGQADRGGRLALAGLRRRHARDADQLAVGQAAAGGRAPPRSIFAL